MNYVRKASVNVDIILNAWHLDLYDINYAVASEEINCLATYAKQLKRRAILLGICSFLGDIVRSFYKLFFVSLRKRPTPGRVIFYAISSNHYESLLPIKRQVKDSTFWGCCDECDDTFWMCWAQIISLLYLPRLLWLYFKSTGYRKETFRYYFKDYLRIYGGYVVFSYLLRHCRPKLVVLANDHSALPRTLLKAASDVRVESVYIQHASVTEKWPPLAFNYALLEGCDALMKYENIGKSKTVVFLIGIAKTDFDVNLFNRQRTVKTLGIALSPDDNYEKVEEVVRGLKSRLPALSIVLRPHPADAIRYPVWDSLSRNYQCALSSAYQETASEFLNKLDSLLAGDSSIHLEAVLHNVYPLYYRFSNTFDDWYGFLKRGLVQSCNSLDELVTCYWRLLEHKPDIRNRAQYYCGTIGTAYDGRSSEVAARLINSWARNDQSLQSEFERIPDMNLEAYALRMLDTTTTKHDSL